MKLFLLLLMAIVCGVQCALTDEEINQKWIEFKETYEKYYADPEEDNFRKQIFIESLQKVEAHNEKYNQGLVTYTLGINQFSDLTKEEMSKYHGYRRP
ncbi:Inhibitor I29 domain containing protein [Asbolus verrucosus]|uniref:Inhibitor I29 domain containing protein n=1 Tax=Asbolus verrucosus TaxID=1661398 RepID=A0A482VBQ0_ASBVE|nr:Inhibitor I29 domain containing protein [Asbolus verrucosus]